MKSKLKMIFRNIEKFIDNNLLVIFGCFILILLAFMIAITSLLCNRECRTDERASLTSYSNGIIFDDTSYIESDFIALQVPICLLGNSEYVAVSNIYLGYNVGGDLGLLYPKRTSNTDWHYEFRSFNSSTRYIDVACTIYSMSYRLSDIRFVYDNSSLDITKENMVNIEFYDLNIKLDEVAEGGVGYYSTINTYKFSSIDFHYGDLVLYNIVNYSSEPSSYNASYINIPLTHFISYDKYNEGYFAGAGVGYNNGYEVGFNNGYLDGYNDGFNEKGVFAVFTDGISSLMDINLFPNFTIGDAFWISVGVVFFGALMKVFRF